MQMVMPNILIAIGFVVLARRDSGAVVGIFHGKCHALGGFMDRLGQCGRQIENIFKVCVGDHQDVSLVVGPPAAGNECSDLGILVDDILLLGALTGPFDATGYLTKWTRIIMWTMRIHPGKGIHGGMIAQRKRVGAALPSFAEIAGGRQPPR